MVSRVQDSRLSATVHRPRPSSLDPHLAAGTVPRSFFSSSFTSAPSTLSDLPTTPALAAKAGIPFSRKEEGSAPKMAPTSFHHAVSEDETLTSETSTPYPFKHVESSTTTARTRERLRSAEEELEKLRYNLEMQMAMAANPRYHTERFQYESSSAAMPPIDIDERIRELKLGELKAKREAPRRSNVGLFKAICSTDLLFLIDTTGSMGSYIGAAKEQVRSIVNDIKAAFLNEADVRMSVIGYKDHGDSPNIQFLDFTSSTDQVLSFLNVLHATGGNDAPEDVLGGIQQALHATWKYKTKCIVHIADAPPHGRTSHDLGDFADNYPNPGSEPHGLTLAPLIGLMIQRQINYTLLRINNTTDLMAYTFLKAYAAASADCTLLQTNKYYSNVYSSSPKSSAKGGLLMHEAELGTTFGALRHLVVRTVTSSVTGTAARYLSRASKPDSELAIIEEDEDLVPQVENASPQWDTPDWFDETLLLNGFSPDVTIHGAHTLDNMMAHDDHITMSVLDLTIHKRRQPFAQGGLRLASYARTAASTNRYVVKSSKRDGSQLAELVEGMRCQALCKLFALEFNALLGNEHSIDFIVTACFKGKSEEASGDTCISLEPFIEGNYVKYNNNAGYVNGDITEKSNKAAQGFSHFTFERSQGRFLVCDLQGVRELLTDPVVHTSDPNRFVLSPTNLGEEGFKFFFASHECNDVCHKLGLKSTASTFMSGTCVFKESWPGLADTVCCSNKLCGKILHRASGKASKILPGYIWCDVCWPQLELSIVSLRCTAPAPYHEFAVSKFFYESQGRATPRRCFKHRDESGAKGPLVLGAKARKNSAPVAGVTVADERLWGTLKPATVTPEDD
ncbi:uncharacterized protein DFL_008716 [Arthrobotrys flagrans]|uniref:Alpha-type protein kinase domain-containing protein n=1 Tax=Arthrobotrys flagrans TaxID=97331 RepID=A0A436ZPJ6_ARTFL|nr:hypothetical protein DFL_008716 [Arthrobotrys flagrans]